MSKDIFTEDQQQQIREAIQEAELNTSGQVKVHIENHCKGDTMDRAAFVFEQLQMNKADLRNGVLFYLALKDGQFAVLGDVAINEKVEEGYWNKVSEMMLNYFRKGEYVNGLSSGVKEVGQQLKQHFPL